MRQAKRRGAVTLLVTTLLLAITLMLVLGSYRATLYQIKRAQNEIETRQDHWRAEGGLECVYTQFKLAGGLPATLQPCLLTTPVVLTLEPLANGYLVSARSHYLSLSKTILTSGALQPGAMQSSADLYFHSSATFSTPDPGALTADGWQCIALRYRSRFYASVVDNKGIIHGIPPYAAFDNPDGKECINLEGDDHLSSLIAGVGVGQDFVLDPDVSPFEAYFGVSVAEHNTVRDSGEFTVISGSGVPKIVSQCGAKLASEIDAGNTRLWLEGGCEIESSEYNSLIDATQTTQGVTILVHDGLMSLMGKPELGASAHSFKGVLFHFNVDYLPTVADWAAFSANAHLNHASSPIEDSYRTTASYYQHGAFSVSGGQFFDAEGQAAIFFDSLDFRFNKDVIDQSRKPFNTVRWRKGSWNDL